MALFAKNNFRAEIQCSQQRQISCWCERFSCLQALGFAFAFLACAWSNAVFAAPLSSEYQHRIAAEVSDKLKDGESARFRWPDIGRDPTVYCGWVNAKNSYGGYTGFELFFALLALDVSGKITGVTVNFESNASANVRESCSHFGFQPERPPPELPH